MSNLVKRTLEKVISYSKVNWGTPFILGFIFLIIPSLILVAVELTTISNTVATWAYFSLILGAFLQLVSFIKHSKEVSE